MVEALRVKTKAPLISLPELTPTHKRWKEACQAIYTGNTTIAEIKKRFTLTPENEQLLCNSK
jgi:hypothetical protein